MIWFIIGLIIGGSVGFVLCALMTISHVAELEAQIQEYGGDCGDQGVIHR